MTASLFLCVDSSINIVSDVTATFDRLGQNGKLYSAEEIYAISLANLIRKTLKQLGVELSNN